MRTVHSFWPLLDLYGIKTEMYYHPAAPGSSSERFAKESTSSSECDPCVVILWTFEIISQIMFYDIY